MHRTLFSTPVVNTVLRAVSLALLRLAGWKVEGTLPAAQASRVLIAAPHTSNWDLPYTLMVGFALHLNLYWMGKASLFSAALRCRDALAGRHRGGPRRRPTTSSPPRRRHCARPTARCSWSCRPRARAAGRAHWKTGFYFIALEAKVPIVLAYMDYERKVAGLGPLFTPSGDVERDMDEVKRFYAGIKGRNADQFDAQ